MRRPALLAAFALAAVAATAALPGAAPAQKTPAVRDWSRTVVATPQGGFRMGNPAAPVKLLEYGSLTCPVCAKFSRTAKPLLVANHVRTGKVSFEFRNMVLNGPDVAATLVARCAGAPRFFDMADSLYAGQDQWLGRIRALSPAETGAVQALPPAQQMVRFAETAGLFDYAARFGVTAPRARACLADPAARLRLARMYDAAIKAGIPGTPSFLINGVQTGVNDWASLGPLLRAYGG